MPGARSISGRDTWRKLFGLPSARAFASAVSTTSYGTDATRAASSLFGLTAANARMFICLSEADVDYREELELGGADHVDEAELVAVERLRAVNDAELEAFRVAGDVDEAGLHAA